MSVKFPLIPEPLLWPLRAGLRVFHRLRAHRNKDHTQEHDDFSIRLAAQARRLADVRAYLSQAERVCRDFPQALAAIRWVQGNDAASSGSTWMENCAQRSTSSLIDELKGEPSSSLSEEAIGLAVEKFGLGYEAAKRRVDAQMIRRI